VVVTVTTTFKIQLNTNMIIYNNTNNLIYNVDSIRGFFIL